MIDPAPSSLLQNSVLPGDQPPAAKYHGLQQLRAAAAVLVVFSHVIVRAFRDVPHDPRIADLVAQLGSLGVWTFFVISGFIMLHVSWRRFGNEGQAVRFIRDRAIRVFPLYWLLTLAYAAFAKEATPVGNVVRSLLFIPHSDAFNGEPYPVLALGWTLNYEVMFYAIFALGLIFSARKAGIAFVLAILVLLTIAGLTLGGLGTAGTFWTSPIILLFLAGMVVCIVRRQRMSQGFWRWSGLAALILLMAEVPVSMLLAETSSSWLPVSIAVAAIGSVALVTLCPGPSGGLPGRWGEFLGDASYSLYLSHPFSIIIVVQLWIRMAPSVPPIVVVPFAVVACLVGGIACYLLIERPLSHGIRRLVDTCGGQDRRTASQA